jgi:hypothetical protein
VIIAVASAGLVANSTPSGIPAAAQRPGSEVQDRGRYSARSISACPRVARIGQVHRDLGVLDPPGGAGVLALHADRAGAFLQVPGLVHHQHRARVGERVHHVAAQVIADGVGVPHRAGEQMLQTVRGQVAAVLGDRPAVLAVQPGQQPQHQPGRVPQRLVTGEPRRDAINHRAERRPPTVRIYPVCHGYRGVSVVPHKHRMIAR